MRRLIGALIVAVALSANALMEPAAAINPGGDWLAYLNGPRHSSYTASETAVTSANAANLRIRWQWSPPPSGVPGRPGSQLVATPAVVDKAIYIGGNDGSFYKLDLRTGAILASRFIAYRPGLTCRKRGFVSSAAVAVDPADGRDTVYVAAPDGYLYALRASNLSIKWRSLIDRPSDTVNDYFNWSSPTVTNGRIYIGSASHCDKPLTRGAVVSYDQSTGQELHRYFTVPRGRVGGGVWTSVAVAGDGSLFTTTGTQVPGTTDRFESVSIVHLDGATLRPLGSFTVPDAQLIRDGDFGASPTVFGPRVGACNKNGYFYALRRSSMGLAWSRRIGSKAAGPAGLTQCSAAGVYDGSSLYLGANSTTIGGVHYPGSVRRLDPRTGKVLWARGLPTSVLGSPSMNGGGLVAVGTFDFLDTPNAVYLLDARTGRIVTTLNTGGRNFSQPVFADGYVITTNELTGMRAYHLPAMVASRRGS